MYVYIISCLLCIVLICILLSNNKSNFENKKIPKVIYMCHKTLNHFDPKRIKKWKKLNPEYEIKLYDNKMSYDFILNNFDKKYADLFNRIPWGPIKADLWRCLIMYKNGGVYADADIIPLKPIRTFLEDDTDVCTCKGASYLGCMFTGPKCGLPNPHFIATIPNTDIFLKTAEIMYERSLKKMSYWNVSIVYSINQTLPQIKQKGNHIIN
ncbi:unnamed protein product, partial [marine sediment metagenome]